VAVEFLQWLAVDAGAVWLDVGCGTGALSDSILDRGEPRVVHGIDPSTGYTAFARKQHAGRPFDACVGSATVLPYTDRSFDVVVSGLVLNFIPDPAAAIAEMRRVARPGAAIAAYVWDYAGRMQLMRTFWDAAVDLDESARPLDEGVRFPICNPASLGELFSDARLGEVTTVEIDVPTVFRDFDDYWQPFLRGQAPMSSG
jgi:SAM-dependent methyltransferase